MTLWGLYFEYAKVNSRLLGTLAALGGAGLAQDALGKPL
jgi:hypothetical protein